MPKKRHSNVYSKPPSTLHRPLFSVPTASTSQNAPPTVAERLMSMRSSTRPSNVVLYGENLRARIERSMPDEIRQLFDLPNTPTPTPRGRHRLPAGPAPPRSWLESSRDAIEKPRGGETRRRTFREVNSLPGLLSFPPESSLMAMCLKSLAINWETQQVYHRNYFSKLPSRVRSIILSYIAVHGPPKGVGYKGLKSILRPSDESQEDFASNDDFDRLDLGSCIGRSVSFKQLGELILPLHTELEDSESWDVTLPPAINAPIHALRMLSLANPPWSISWTKMLYFVPSIPTLTHLSLANWPTPKLLPNATDDVPCQDTGGLCFTLEFDNSEQTLLLRRLSSALYSLEYLDLNGCQNWAAALYFRTPDCPGIDWVSQWGKIRHISLRSGVDLRSPDGAGAAVKDPPLLRLSKATYVKETILLALKIEGFIQKQRGWIEVAHDEWPSQDYTGLDEKLVYVARRLDEGYENFHARGGDRTLPGRKRPRNLRTGPLPSRPIDL